MKTDRWIALAAFLCLSVPGVASSSSVYEDCLLSEVLAGGPVTAEDIKKSCQARVAGAGDAAALVRQRLAQSSLHQRFSILAYKPNYILPLVYSLSARDSSEYQQQFGNPDIYFDNAEAQFQISIKMPILTHIYGRNIQLSAGYTARSFWQVYNKALSSPFREVNHEPEIWLRQPGNMRILGFDNVANALGLVHQSNGRGGNLSRSWNRVYGQFVFERRRLVLALKIWQRLDESASSDDNPDILDYMGHGELMLVYAGKNGASLTMISRNNLESGFERGALEASWSFPVVDRDDIKGYVKLFSGYGESLIDYDRRLDSIGVGLSVSDWL